ncbi:MAG: hypothetical protein LAP87_17590 [Acidobacteriia bacterium]|nr:hypothetical protein [Terriglobia bacterium]
MKLLEAVRLIQWYHFADQTLPVGRSCLLFGDNGCGKSTVLDAIQVALVADGNDFRLNRAANEHSKRTLYGYLRWKQSSEDEARPGAVRYGRDPCTSYVLLQFRDDGDDGTGFTCGIGFESGDSEQSIAKTCFIEPDLGIADIEAVIPDLVSGAPRVVPLKDFRMWLRTRHVVLWNDVGSYREELRHRLGALPATFHRLLVKALAFKPLGQVRQFVFDYLLDPKPVDTAALQANLEHYKRLEAEARDAQRRIEELNQIVAMGEKIEAERRVAISHKYQELRAHYEESALLGMKLEAEIIEVGRTRELQEREVTRLADLLGEHERELIRLRTQLEGYESFHRLNEINRDLEFTERQLRDARTHEEELNGVLVQQREALRALFGGLEVFGGGATPETLARLDAAVAAMRNLTDADIRLLEQTFTKSVAQLYILRAERQRELSDIDYEAGELRREMKGLEEGRPVYPDGAAALLDLLSRNLQGLRQPKPLCELIEIAELRWIDAIEGYLHTRRFDIIVSPEDYRRALMLYERHKSRYSWQGRDIFISGVGLVDIEKLQRAGLRAQKGSLAEKVATEDAYARTYCDYLLGDVMCVDNEQQLREHRAAIRGRDPDAVLRRDLRLDVSLVSQPLPRRAALVRTGSAG